MPSLSSGVRRVTRLMSLARAYARAASIRAYTIECSIWSTRAP